MQIPARPREIAAEVVLSLAMLCAACAVALGVLSRSLQP